MSNVCSQHLFLPEFHGGGYGIASAAGEAVYELNPVVVTATRTEKADIDVPANVTVVTAKKSKKPAIKMHSMRSSLRWA